MDIDNKGVIIGVTNYLVQVSGPFVASFIFLYS